MGHEPCAAAIAGYDAHAIRAPSPPIENVLQVANLHSKARPGADLLLGTPRVFVVDDDASIRTYLRRLLEIRGFTVETCASGAELLARVRVDRPGCILLDLSMPIMGGLEVQQQLRRRGVLLPVIFLSGSGDISIAVEAMRDGATDFIEKPFDANDLVARVRNATDWHGERVDQDAERRDVQARLDGLTPRETSVLERVVIGETSKETARALGISHRTVEVHRRHLMHKLHAPTLADLVRMGLVARDPRRAN